MRKISISAPDFLGDSLHTRPPVMEMQPYCVRAAVIMARWGMGPKTFQTLLAHGILKPWVNASGLMLYRLQDVVHLEREGWNQRDGLPPSENYPLTGDRAPDKKTKPKG